MSFLFFPEETKKKQSRRDDTKLKALLAQKKALETKIHKIKRMRFLKEKNEAGRLEQLTEKWKDVGIEALKELVQTQTGERKYSEKELLKGAGINPELLDIEEDTDGSAE
ncbi:MAG: uncharacterized protein A8A55_0423 [Amphiamblys sp. WSBS2006]|nr:MAG: uncharacterized protein A8A55_0423 [Amphiamblys sp. WSBS2006]